MCKCGFKYYRDGDVHLECPHCGQQFFSFYREVQNDSETSKDADKKSGAYREGLPLDGETLRTW